ncbi:MAG: GTP 3',8-cyclase MoaA [Flavobacteriia bacterium]|jgi:molybdenum cofactor biosynthesis protein A
MEKTNPILIDKFGRVHDYLRISLTERCNLRCFYCMPEEGIQLREKTEFMSTEELMHIAKTFVDLGIKKIRLTGGEPLIRKDIASILRQLGELPVELAITTNGVLIDKYIDDLKSAGVEKINISLDSLVEDKFNQISRRNYFTKIKDNISLLLANKFDVKVNVVVIKDVNDNEIIDFINWSSKEIINIRFIEFMPFDGNKWDKSKQVGHKEILDIIHSYYSESNVLKLNDAVNDTCKNYKIKGAKGTFGIISSISNPFCDSCNRIRLTADGKLKNCLFSADESNLLTALRANKEILPIIYNNIYMKAKERGGVFNSNNTILSKYKNRSMVSIGG